jgi:hypothetical protein
MEESDECELEQSSHVNRAHPRFKAYVNNQMCTETCDCVPFGGLMLAVAVMVVSHG